MRLIALTCPEFTGALTELFPGQQRDWKDSRIYVYPDKATGTLPVKKKKVFPHFANKVKNLNRSTEMRTEAVNTSDQHGELCDELLETAWPNQSAAFEHFTRSPISVGCSLIPETRFV